jgi:FMN phosphatase YigB (HAD superfamily)
MKCVILDFDGTFTDAEAEGAPFAAAFRDGIFDLVGRDISAEWDEMKQTIEADPRRFGWVFDGRIVAPALADPYIRATTTAQGVLDRVGVLKNPEARNAVVQGLYHWAYGKTLSVFREEAKDVLEAILAKGLRTYCITNATTDGVIKKLESLIPGVVTEKRIHIHGAAQKFWIGPPKQPDARWEKVPTEYRVDGLERPIFVRRGRYFDAIQQVFAEAQCDPRDVIVCGDIFELDLSLPLNLGMQIHLVQGKTTPDYELAEVKRVGQTAGSLKALLDRL